MSDLGMLARESAARTEPHLTGYCREQLLPGIRQGPSRFTHRGGSPVFNEGELTAKRGGLTVQEYRWKTIRKWLKE